MTPTSNHKENRGRVRIPADVERPDKLLAGLTARQLAVLAATAIILWVAYAATRHLLPTVAFVIVAVPVGAAGVTVALGRVEGVAADRWVTAAFWHHRRPRRLVPAPDGIPPTPTFLPTTPAGVVPAPLLLPVADVRPDGIVDLGADGLAVIGEASAVTFGLRTPGEQEALVAGFARFLNSLADPVQIVVRAEPLDLTPTITHLTENAPALPHPGLEAAALGHARFLTDLAEHHDLLRRHVLVVFRQPAGDNPASRLHRRAAEAVTALAAAGVTLTILDAPTATTQLTHATNPSTAATAASLLGDAVPVTLTTAPGANADVAGRPGGFG